MLLTADELIEKFFGSSKKISTHKLFRLAKKGQIPSVKLDGRVFFPETEFSKWIAAEASKCKTAPDVLEHYGRDKKYGRLRVINE